MAAAPISGKSIEPDVVLRADVDRTEECLSGRATKRILEPEQHNLANKGCTRRRIFGRVEAAGDQQSGFAN